MISVMTRYFRYNRIYLLMIGLWPYQQSKLVQFQLILLYGILISFIVCQYAVFMFVECTIDIIINALSIASFFTLFMIQYNGFRVKLHIVKQFLEELEYVCDELEDKNEIAIIKKYGNNAQRYTALTMLFHLSNIAVLLLLTIWPFIPGIVNKSYVANTLRECMPVYYVNQEKYLYIYIPHAFVAAVVGGVALAATGTLIISYLQHACGLFRIASYRIEKALMASVVKKIGLKDETTIYKEIILAIDIHRKAVRFSQFLFSNFQGTNFLLIIVCVVCLSLNLYGISDIRTLGNETEKFIVHFSIVSIIFLLLFLLNYAGQEITDHNDHVFSTIYNVHWYVAPLHIQKLILFLLQRGSKTVNLHLSGIFVLSFKFFATLMKTSISYCTVMYSTRQ